MKLIYSLSLMVTACFAAINVDAQNNANADSAYNGYLSAFLVQNGSTAFFCNGLTDRSMAYMWGDAYMITGVEDAYDRSPTSDKVQLISNLLNTFMANNNGSDWSWDTWNDDCAWAEVAFARGYIITGNITYLNAATQNWNMVWNRAWDTSLGGGIWENQSKATKAALCNDPAIIAGCYIYEATGDSGYLTKCQQIYAWVRANLLTTSSGVINEAMTSGGALQPSDNAYNDGAFVNAADALYKITGTSQYYNDAKLAADHLKNNFNPLYSPSGGAWADQAVRGVSRFARDNNLWSTYLPWLTSQCTAAWSNRRTDYNITWNNWESPTPTDNTKVFAMDCVSAMVVQMVSQIDQKVGTHVIINDDNGLAIDNGSSSSQGAGMIQWGSNGGRAQKWRFTQNSDTSWNIVSMYSGQALEDPGFSTTSGKQMDQWGENFGSNQKWWVDQQSDGTYKIWNQSSSDALDDNSHTTNGTPLVQWPWTGQTNQKWKIQ